MTDAVDHFADLFAEYEGPVPGKVEKPLFVEPCPGCRGSGVFRGYSGRLIGNCFKCKGTGKVEFKSSQLERQKRAEYADKVKQRKAITLAEKRAAWIEQNPAEYKWLLDNYQSWEFATSLHEALTKYGALTDGQIGAVRRCIQKNAERTAERTAQRAAAVANAPTVSIQAIETAFAHAMSRGIKRPKVRLGDFKLSVAPATGANAGAVYVKRGEEYLGKIKDGRFVKAWACNEVTEAEVVELCSNPAENAVAYGRRTGRCAICSKELTVGESIDRGIGPICAEKYGW